MARFKVGDRVKCIESTVYVNKGQVGTVAEDKAEYPFVLWDDGEKWSIYELKLEPYTDPASEIAQIVENSINSTEPIPIDRFEFKYHDEYGRTLSHKFEQSEGDYDLCDVIASFRLFILGIGWGREVVDKYIREDRL